MPALSWKDASEIVVGHLLSGSLSPLSVRADQVIQPYPALLKRLRRTRPGHAPLSSDQVIALIGLPAYQAALEAFSRTEKTPVDWSGLLAQSASYHALGQLMERDARKLQAGEMVDLTPLRLALRKAEIGDIKLQPLSEISLEGSDFDTTGYQPLDDWVGGLPCASQTLVVGAPGIGKTYFALALAAAYAKRKRLVGFFSLEMTSRQLARRVMLQMRLPRTVASRILICDEILTPEEVSRVVSYTDHLDLAIVDFAELLVPGEKSEAVMSNAYQTLAFSAKHFDLPILVLSQMNRATMNEIPVLGSPRYSGHADAVTALELGLYNPTRVRLSAPNGNGLMLDPGNGAIVILKSRYGTKMKGEIGAIEVPFTPQSGWGTRAVRWHSFS